MAKIHSKSVRKAKEKLKVADKGKLSYKKLGKPAQKMLAKRLKAGYKLPVRHVNTAEKKESAA